MSDEPAKGPSDADKELEREVRANRKFSVAEAIGRLAGPGMMKGVSPGAAAAAGGGGRGVRPEAPAERRRGAGGPVRCRTLNSK